MRHNTTQQLGKAFTEFYFNEIGTYLFHLDEDAIVEGIESDGKGDLNVDFAFEQDNQYIICQFKYKGNKSKVTRDELSGFFNIPYRLLDEPYFESNANAILKDVLRNFDAHSPVQFYFITNERINKSDSIRDDFNLLRKSVEEKWDH